jgi:hypothetical protein
LEVTDPTPDEDGTDRPATPVVDVSAALGEAGHEVHDLGFDGVADSAPVLHHAEDGNPEDPEDEILRKMATRGVDGVT